jgi:hypothetical protein
MHLYFTLLVLFIFIILKTIKSPVKLFMNQITPAFQQTSLVVLRLNRKSYSKLIQSLIILITHRKSNTFPNKMHCLVFLTLIHRQREIVHCFILQSQSQLQKTNIKTKISTRIIPFKHLFQLL